MNAELEALLNSYLAWKEAAESGAKAEDLFALFDSRLDDVLARCPSLTKPRLRSLIQMRYGKWLGAQGNPSAMPPKA